MSKLFEEAIADAKKLKEVAEQNAQKAIIESVTPQIKKFIEKTLLEQKDDDGVSEEDSESQPDAQEESFVLDESAIKSLVKMIGAEKIYDRVNRKKTINESVETALNNLDRNDRLRMIQLIKKINENKNILTNDDIINDQTNSFKEKMKMRNREKFYEVDLSLLRENVQDRKIELMQHEQEQQDKDEMMRYEMASVDSEEFSEDMDSGDQANEEYAEMARMYETDGISQDEVSDEDPDEMSSIDMDPTDMLAELSYLLEQEEEEEEPSDEDSDDMGELEDMEGDEDAGGGAGGDMLAKDEVEAQIEELIADLGLDIGGAAGGADLGELEDVDVEGEGLAEAYDVDPRILRQELRNVKRMIREGKVDHHFGGKGSGKTSHANAYGGAGPKKHGHQKSFGGGSYGKDAFVSPPQLNKLNEAIRKLRRQNRSQQEKLNKYRGAVHTLREQLEDLNLFNAKLLYVNKLLQNKSLNESQKKSVIKALDEAKSLGETKALYKSLTESLGSSRSTLNESTRFGSSSRTTTSSSGIKNRTVGESDRWAKLAGLK